MTDKDFIPYKQASLLKDIGFNSPCLAYYTFSTERLCRSGSLNQTTDFEYITLEGLYHNYSLAPTYSQTFRWFRETHNLFYSIELFEDEFKKYYKAFVCDNTGNYTSALTSENNPSHSSFAFSSYEAAELACVEKLIEIVKNKKIKK